MQFLISVAELKKKLASDFDICYLTLLYSNIKYERLSTSREPGVCQKSISRKTGKGCTLYKFLVEGKSCRE
jgi:hypothetical protein